MKPRRVPQIFIFRRRRRGHSSRHAYARFESEMATVVSLRVVARVPTGAAPSGSTRRRGANRVPGCKQEAQDSRRIKSVAARSSPVDVEEPETKTEAFDDPLADVFKQLYPGGGVKRIKWGVFKEDVDASSVTTTEEEQAELRAEAACSLTNIDADERARRGKAGTAFGIACALIAAVQLATGAPPAQRAVIAVPLFLGLGFKGSEATGL